MSRIRTTKPDYWSDETIGLLSRDARLLFIATWNFADDEGLLRWSAEYLKASAFMYDDDLNVLAMQKLMDEITDKGLVFPYVGGRARSRLGWIVNFRRHQKINRPYPGQLPPPPLDDPDVLLVYARRDRFACRVCHEPIAEDASDARLRRIKPSRGDDPTNIAVTHDGCELPEPTEPVQDTLPGTGADSRSGSGSGSRNGARRTAAKAAASSRATRIPDPWIVTEELRAWFRESCPHVDGPRENQKFVNYWTAKAGKDATKKRWDLTWKNWMLDAEERAPRSRNGGPRSSTTDDRVRQALEAGEEVQALIDARAAS